MPKENKVVENVLATIGAVCWTVQIIPQLWKSWRSKSTQGLSAILMFVWALSSLPFASYIVAEDLSIPLKIQPHVFGFLCALSWGQCLHYGRGIEARKALLILAAFFTVWAGFETGSIYALKAGVKHGTTAPLQLYGYLSAVMLAGAVLPEYYEIYKLKEVIGISLVFLAVDIAGGIFSFVSLFFRPELDVAAFRVSYLLVVVLDGGVVILAFILNPRAKRRRELDLDPRTVTELQTPRDTPATMSRPVSLREATRATLSVAEQGSLDGRDPDEELTDRGHVERKGSLVSSQEAAQHNLRRTRSAAKNHRSQKDEPVPGQQVDADVDVDHQLSQRRSRNKDSWKEEHG